MTAFKLAWLVLPALIAAAPGASETPRDLLTYAAYQDRDQTAALARVDRAHAVAQAAATRAPDDQDSAVVAAIATAYRAKLTGGRGEAVAARHQIEAVCQRFPRNAEAQLALGAWHMGVVAKVGGFLARAGAGARKDTGLAALDRAVALSGGRVAIVAMAGMLRIFSDPKDSRGRALVEAADHGAAPAALDRISQRAAANIAAALRRGDNQGAKAIADRWLPFGWYHG